jgi:hypothetical protein
MEVFGRVANGRDRSNAPYDIGVFMQKSGTLSVAVRKPEIIALKKILFGFEGDKMYLLKSDADNALSIAPNNSRYYIRSTHKEVIKRVQDCEGYYTAYFDKQRKEWYINLKHKEEK